jgi:hypothetical protein
MLVACLQCAPAVIPRRMVHPDFFKKGLGLLQVDKNESDTDGCISCRVTIFEDHMIRDINAGRFSSNSSLVLLTHGLALRIFLMRWFHWTVDEFLNVFNPPNCQPLVCGPSTKS